MTGYRLFFPPTLIWIKKKEGIFCTGSLVAFQPVNIGPVAGNLTMMKAFFQPAATPPSVGIPRWYNWLHHAAVPIPDRSIRP
jgi:hypothetical protein